MAETSTERTDARLSEALDAMPHKVWMVRLDGPAIYYNRAMREFAGCALRLPDRQSRERALVHPDDLSRFISERNSALECGSDWSVEVRLKCPHGAYRWHRLNFSMLRTPGEADAWLATATDVDDLHQALRAAQQSEERLRLAAEAAQLGFYIFDLRTQEHYWSPELKAIFGLSAGITPPASIVDWIHREDRLRFEALRKASLDPHGTGTFEDEHRIIRRDGAVRWVFVKGRVSFVEKGSTREPRLGLGFVLDITERKITEQALVESETRYRTLVENASDIVATLQPNGRIDSINPAVEKVLGYAPEEVMGRSLAQFVAADQMKSRGVKLRRKLAGGPSTQCDLKIRARDGQQRVLEVNSQLSFDRDGRPTAIHSIARDVTERKEAEARQNLLVEEMQHRTKNLMSVFQSIATNTLKRSRDLESALETLVGRLHALAHAQDFVAAGPGGGVPLRQLLEAELRPFGARAHMRGKPIVVGGRFAQAMALVVHELATNAVKHGSFSSPQGRVTIEWHIRRSETEPQLHFSWVERGGPPVRAPSATGFGTLLMSSLAQARTTFGEQGFEYDFALSLAEATRTGS
jgi:PAS domain S-box-containing protein